MDKKKGVRSSKKLTVEKVTKTTSSGKGRGKGQQGLQRQITITKSIPAAKGHVFRNQNMPRWKISSRGSVTINHSEMISGVASAITPNSTIRGTLINPGNELLFPWLHKVASSWERYQFKKLRFRWVPACSTAREGFMMIGIDYDINDGLPTTEQQFAAYKGTTKGPLWQEQSCLVDPKDINNQLKTFLITQATGLSEKDSKLYFMGNFIFYTGASNVATYAGDLFVDYEVELSVPDGKGGHSVFTNIPDGTGGIRSRNNPLVNYLPIEKFPIESNGIGGMSIPVTWTKFMFQVAGTGLGAISTGNIILQSGGLKFTTRNLLSVDGLTAFWVIYLLAKNAVTFAYFNFTSASTTITSCNATIQDASAEEAAAVVGAFYGDPADTILGTL